MAILIFWICTLQDSVPAGSYNDLFLSSVCVCSVFVVLLCLLEDDNSTVDIALSTPWLSEKLEVGRQTWYWKDFEVFGLSLVFLHLVTSTCDHNSICHEDRHDWSYVSFTFVSERKNFEFGAYDIVHESNEMSFR